MVEMRPLRILIVDDHAMVRSGLKDFIFSFDWMETIGEATNGAEAVTFCEQHDVDVVLMDMVMPVMTGSEATRRILSLGKPIKVVALTSFHEQGLVEEALKAGASSYLLKNVSAVELAAAIRATHDGRTMLAPEASDALVNAIRQEPPLGFDLTEREHEVLTLMAEGMTNLEIADRLSLSKATVKYHLTNAFSKLGARNRVEATTIALEHGLVTHHNE